jgi:hypothetical protein
MRGMIDTVRESVNSIHNVDWSRICLKLFSSNYWCMMYRRLISLPLYSQESATPQRPYSVVIPHIRSILVFQQWTDNNG